MCVFLPPPRRRRARTQVPATTRSACSATFPAGRSTPSGRAWCARSERERTNDDDDPATPWQTRGTRASCDLPWRCERILLFSSVVSHGPAYIVLCHQFLASGHCIHFYIYKAYSEQYVPTKTIVSTRLSANQRRSSIGRRLPHVQLACDFVSAAFSTISAPSRL